MTPLPAAPLVPMRAAATRRIHCLQSPPQLHRNRHRNRHRHRHRRPWHSTSRNNSSSNSGNGNGNSSGSSNNSTNTSSSLPSSPPPPPLGPNRNREIFQSSFVIGSLAGTCGALAGMGGGFLMVPLMTARNKFFRLGLTQHQAHATSLFAVATTGLAGALSYSSGTSTATTSNHNHSSNNNVDLEVAVAIAISGMATASLGAHASARLSQRTLRRALGIFMLLIAPTIPAKDLLWKTKTTNENSTTTTATSSSPSSPSSSSSSSSTTKASTTTDAFATTEPLDVRRYGTAAGIGCCSGFLAGMFGVGGGAVVVPALTLFLDMNHYQALGTSLCAMVPTAVVGTATHMSKGTVAMRVAPGLAIGAFCGGLLGGNLGLSIPENTLRCGFSATMVLLGLRTLLKA